MRLFYSLTRILSFLAERKARNLGVLVTIALVDEGGQLLAYGRMDGALPASGELAVSKAYTAAALRMPTQEVGALAQPGRSLYGIQHTHQGRIVLFGGGLPLRLGGGVVGGVGISGGTVEEDIRIAEAVVKALEEMEDWSHQIEADQIGRSIQRGGVECGESAFQKFGRESNGSPMTELVSITTGAVLLAGGYGD
jgi:uncharacterized protein GlcG (DUF336 family)